MAVVTFVFCAALAFGNRSVNPTARAQLLIRASRRVVVSSLSWESNNRIMMGYAQNTSLKKGLCYDLNEFVDYGFLNKEYLLVDIEPGSDVADVERR